MLLDRNRIFWSDPDMSEYEAAALVFMQAERLANMGSLMQGNQSIIQSEAANFTTYLTGYLLIAYFIGANLTKIQVSILNVLYLFVIGFSAYTLTASILAGSALFARYQEMGGTIGTLETSVDAVLFEILVVLLTLLILSPFYFMWSIRHPKTP
jgi:hypothetical protein